MFSLLPTIYPQDFVDFIIRNYFRFLDDVFHAWLRSFDITQFYEIFENLDPNLKFLFSALSTITNCLDITFKVVDNMVVMDVYHKPTDSFNFLHHTSCHPLHTKDNIALSLGKRIVNIVSGDYGPRLDQLKARLIQLGHTIDRTFTKIFEPKSMPTNDEENVLVFTQTFNPRHRFDPKIISNSLSQLPNPEMRKAFSKCRVVMGTRQPKSLGKMLIRSKFTPSPTQAPTKEVGLYICKKSCIYHNTGYFRPCTQFKFGKFHWKYTRYFDCDSANVLYILICNNCWKFYIGETQETKQRTRKHKSDVLHPENSNCTKLSRHLRSCSNLVEPYFQIYPVYYVEDLEQRRFVEKRWIKYFRPPSTAILRISAFFSLFFE